MYLWGTPQGLVIPACVLSLTNTRNAIPKLPISIIPLPKQYYIFWPILRLLGTLHKHDDDRNQKAKKERFKEQKQWPCKCGKISSFFCRHLQNNNVKLPNLKLNAFATDYFSE